MLAEQEQREGQRVGSRLVPGQQQRHHMIVNLRRAHAVADLPVGQQGGNHVAAVSGGIGPAPVDHLIDDLVHRRLRRILRLVGHSRRLPAGHAARTRPAGTPQDPAARPGETFEGGLQ